MFKWQTRFPAATIFLFSTLKVNVINKKVKQSRYTPWRRLGEEAI
jgi:hypothetical protein